MCKVTPWAGKLYKPPCDVWFLGGLEAGEAGEITIGIGEEAKPLSHCPVGGAGTDRSLLETLPQEGERGGKTQLTTRDFHPCGVAHNHIQKT